MTAEITPEERAEWRKYTEYVFADHKMHGIAAAKQQEKILRLLDALEAVEDERDKLNILARHRRHNIEVLLQRAKRAEAERDALADVIAEMHECSLCPVSGCPGMGNKDDSELCHAGSLSYARARVEVKK